MSVLLCECSFNSHVRNRVMFSVSIYPRPDPTANYSPFVHPGFFPFFTRPPEKTFSINGRNRWIYFPAEEEQLVMFYPHLFILIPVPFSGCIFCAIYFYFICFLATKKPRCQPGILHPTRTISRPNNSLWAPQQQHPFLTAPQRLLLRLSGSGAATSDFYAFYTEIVAFSAI